jgi:hypothetical protein
MSVLAVCAEIEVTGREVCIVLRHFHVAAGTYDTCCIHCAEQRLVAFRSKALFVIRFACSRPTEGMETQFGVFLYPRCPAVCLHGDFVHIKTLPVIDSSHVLKGLTQVAFCASRSGIYI